MSIDTAAKIADEADDTVRGALAPTGSDKSVDFLPSEKLDSSPESTGEMIGGAPAIPITEGMGTGSEDRTPAEELDAAALDALGDDDRGAETAEELRSAA